MINMIGQMVIQLEYFLLLIIVPIAIVAEIFTLKIGLVVTKAESRRRFKFCAVSFLIQAAAIFFILSPVFLTFLAGGFENQGPDPGLIIPLGILALFIDLQILNVIHKLGIKRALVVFFFMAITGIIIGFSTALVIQTTQITPN